MVATFVTMYIGGKLKEKLREKKRKKRKERKEKWDIRTNRRIK